jgi:glycerol-1-phosphate dehydrogenase [NAD(P)+]
VTGEFTTVYGRNLVSELPNFVPRPYLVVTMDDLWPRFADQLDGPGMAGVHHVQTLDVDELASVVDQLPACASVIGLGGGQAVDVAKFVTWRRGLPLFQVPTAMTVNAPFGQRAGLRQDGIVRYLGWAVPQAVYVDFDVIASAPLGLNRAGVGDILCYRTAELDWRLTSDLGKEEPAWPYDGRLVEAAQVRFQSVMGALDAIHDVSDGNTFHAAGWNPRHIEGVEHFFFYNLEKRTGRHFIHGQPVGLGIVLGSVLHDHGADEMVAALRRVGVDIRPEAMGVTWDDAAGAMQSLGMFVRDAGLWHSIADERPIDDAIVGRVQALVDAAYGPWGAG